MVEKTPTHFTLFVFVGCIPVKEVYFTQPYPALSAVVAKCSLNQLRALSNQPNSVSCFKTMFTTNYHKQVSHASGRPTVFLKMCTKQ